MSVGQVFKVSAFCHKGAPMITFRTLPAALAALFLAFPITENAVAESSVDRIATADAQLLVPATTFARILKSHLSAARALPPEVGRFYSERSFRPFWFDADGRPNSSATALLAWVGSADAHALPPARYRRGELAARLAALPSVTSPDHAAREIELTELFLTYARDLSSGVLDPRRIDRRIDVAPHRPDAAVLLAGLDAADDVRTYLAGLAPASADYTRLLELYAALRDIAATGGWGERVAPGPTLRLGDRDPRVLQLRRRLTTMGDLPPSERVAAAQTMIDAATAENDPLLFDTALDAAVRRFQARHGLNTDGIVGHATLAAINISAEERARQAAVNLERMRWLNYDLGQRHIMVNTAAFTMTVVEDGRAIFTTRAVVGQARDHQTPEFNDELEFVVINPLWHVPRSIATEEILPLLQEDPGYLAEHNMRLVDSDLPAEAIDWRQITADTFPGRLVQMSGPDNALGTVKFLFPNRHSVYMHDTPAKRLFDRDRRDFSHGCIRLQDPLGFAYYLLALEGYDDPAATFARLRATGEERWLRLHEKIPVYVTYRTAWVSEDGTWNFRADVYGRDRKLWRALERMGVRLAPVGE